MLNTLLYTYLISSHCTHIFRLVRILLLKQVVLQHHPLSLDVFKMQREPIVTIYLLKKKLYSVEFHRFVSLLQYGSLCTIYSIQSTTNKFMTLLCFFKNLYLGFLPQKLKKLPLTLQFQVTFSHLLSFKLAMSLLHFVILLYNTHFESLIL